MASVALLASATAALATAPPAASKPYLSEVTQVTIQTDKLVSQTNLRYASWNIDSSANRGTIPS